MLDGNHDFADFRDERSASHEGQHNMRELLAKLDALEKEFGHFIRETLREANSAGTARLGGGD